jgi:hypothetical protein
MRLIKKGWPFVTIALLCNTAAPACIADVSWRFEPNSKRKIALIPAILSGKLNS